MRAAARLAPQRCCASSRRKCDPDRKFRATFQASRKPRSAASGRQALIGSVIGFNPPTGAGAVTYRASRLSTAHSAHRCRRKCSLTVGASSTAIPAFLRPPRRHTPLSLSRVLLTVPHGAQLARWSRVLRQTIGIDQIDAEPGVSSASCHRCCSKNFCWSRLASWSEYPCVLRRAHGSVVETIQHVGSYLPPARDKLLLASAAAWKASNLG